MKSISARFVSFLLILSLAVGFMDNTAFAFAQKPKLNVKKLNLTVNTDFNLRVYNLKKKQKVTFTSSAPKIVSVTTSKNSAKRATVKALSVGSAIINVTIRKNNQSVRRLKCKVKVTPNAIGIKFYKRKLYLKPREQFELEPIIKPNTSREQPLFESDDPEVATVNSRGVITALMPGITTITATLLSSGQTATCMVFVSNDVDEEEWEN